MLVTTRAFGTRSRHFSRSSGSGWSSPVPHDEQSNHRPLASIPHSFEPDRHVAPHDTNRKGRVPPGNREISFAMSEFTTVRIPLGTPCRQKPARGAQGLFGSAHFEVGERRSLFRRRSLGGGGGSFRSARDSPSMARASIQQRRRRLQQAFRLAAQSAKAARPVEEIGRARRTKRGTRSWRCPHAVRAEGGTSERK